MKLLIKSECKDPHQYCLLRELYGPARLVSGELVPEDKGTALGAPLQDDDQVLAGGAQEHLPLAGLLGGEGVAGGKFRGDLNRAISTEIKRTK